MVSYITLGVNDLAQAKQFYSAFLPAIGYHLEELPDGLSCTAANTRKRADSLPTIYVKLPFDGQPATSGNGTMIAFNARDQKQVRMLHDAALAAGGTNDGAPGFRDAYGPRFYVGYLRDPQGNKIALYSNNPEDPGRDG